MAATAAPDREAARDLRGWRDARLGSFYIRITPGVGAAGPRASAGSGALVAPTVRLHVERLPADSAQSPAGAAGPCSMHLSVRLLDPDLLGRGDAASHECGPRSDGRCAEWASSVPCNANEAHEFEVPVCPGVHIIQVDVYNDEYAELGLERRDVRIFEVMSADEKGRLVRYRREESGNQNIPYNRANIINRIIAARQYQSYLEVGVRSGITFRSVSCAHKESVDPNKDDLFPELTHHMTSDEAFAHFRAAGKDCFDLIFIDGLHEADQVFSRCMYACISQTHACMHAS